MSHNSHSSRIVVIGAGWAGVWSALGAVRTLEQAGRKDVEVVVLAPEPNLLIRVRLYEADISNLKPPVQELFESLGIRFIAAHVLHIRANEHEIEYRVPGTNQETHTISYDRLVLASGSQVAKPDIAGLEHAFTVDNYPDAVKFDKHLHSLASLPSSVARNTIVIAGGGFTGIEVACEMPSRLRSILGENDYKVIVVERAGAIGPDLGPGPRPVIEKALETLDVKVYTGESVVSVQEDALITSSGRRIETMTVVWTAGLVASDLTVQIPGARFDSIGRIQVNEYLMADTIPDIFLAGDVARAPADDQGHSTLMSCQHAIPMGKFAGHNVAQHLLGLPLLRFSPPAYGTCLDLGEWGAVVTEGWDRQIYAEGADAKVTKRMISQQLIYPPTNRQDAFIQANPAAQPVQKGGKYEYQLVEL